jgi:hypothetical protein
MMASLVLLPVIAKAGDGLFVKSKMSEVFAE